MSKSIEENSTGIYIVEFLDGAKDILFKPCYGNLTILERADCTSYNPEECYLNFGAESVSTQYRDATKLTIDEGKLVYNFILSLLDKRKVVEEIARLEQERAEIDKRIKELKERGL